MGCRRDFMRYRVMTDGREFKVRIKKLFFWSDMMTGYEGHQGGGCCKNLITFKSYKEAVDYMQLHYGTRAVQDKPWLPFLDVLK